MQIQFNVGTADTLRDAMVNPESYRGLLVQISGYDAYFVTLSALARAGGVEVLARGSRSVKAHSRGKASTS